MLTKEIVQADIDALPPKYKTVGVDALIKRYVKEKQDLSFLREHVLTEQQFHRIYFHGSLKQIRKVSERLEWLDGNLLFSDWWHTDENIAFVRDADIEEALRYAEKYIHNNDPFVRRWGYVMFISRLCRNRGALEKILSLTHDDEHYYVQMGQAWLIAELAIFFSDEVFEWLKESGLSYAITGKAIQKICDSYRVDDATKERFKSLRVQKR